MTLLNKVIRVANKSIDMCNLGNIFDIYIMVKGSPQQTRLWRCCQGLNKLTLFNNEVVEGRFALVSILSDNVDFFNNTRNIYIDRETKIGTIFVIYAYSDGIQSYCYVIKNEQDYENYKQSIKDWEG